ncbi:hypothetical protein IF1G_03680 [Cordyceps javanica]|uniref:Uncharacterized protein n=1 Tax=Cordyceps javanica TaxID=43265 RepID=A0A545V884_9HYPO|nr:hypothetical protein IF1G_03680 [Cordyceps javanica]
MLNVVSSERSFSIQNGCRLPGLITVVSCCRLHERHRTTLAFRNRHLVGTPYSRTNKIRMQSKGLTRHT